MSTLPAADVSQRLTSRALRLSSGQAAGIAAFLALLGLSTIWSTVTTLWGMWMTDALKSIGMMIPLVSFVLILRAWRSLDWEMDGRWWGLVILAVTAAIGHLREQAVLVFVLSPQWNIYIPPASLLAFAYGAGVVLLFGGPRLFRAALFPIVLLWFVNPVPHVFNVFVDLPLQRISAHVARAFAIALGQPLTPDQMRLMFTPDFGMFIAPGCNGIRGAVTMGFIALVAGYVYRFRWHAHAAVVAGAILLGYVFNFVRLCTLVLYYIVALRIRWLRPRAEMGDYIIGACLFLLASFLLFYVIRRLGDSPRQVKPEAPEEMAPATASGSPGLRLVAMTLFVLFGCYGVAHAMRSGHASNAAETNSSPGALGPFPKQIGAYTLVRSWNENLNSGALLFHWADYAPAGGGTHIAVGVSPVLGAHDTLICHSARGEDPLWRDQLTVTMANQVPVSFSMSFYDSATQSLEATTICSGSSCGEYTSERRHFGFVYSRPDPKAIFTRDPQRPIPILLKAETADTSMPSDLARQELGTAMKGFLASANLDLLTQPYRSR
ncbi:exosortase J [Edaphobacter bradus]|uniref:exosortase J n=1 Tax=Edaphobacter bradus TaxID=2259016 RepID=UPI0021DF6FF3|nr:exosortase J [Edaphobacter bradus]